MKKRKKISGKRNSGSAPFVRWFAIELTREQPEDPNCVRVIASTDNAVDWGGFREVLVHTPEAVDMRSAATCLFNHNRNMPIGGIRSCQVDGKKMTAELEISPDARADSGVKILEAVRKGYIRGVSIGYQYDMANCDVVQDDEGRTTVTARKWQLREISITPTQADITAQVVRSLPEGFKAVKPAEGNPMNELEKQKFRNAARAAGLNDAEIDAILSREGMTYTKAMEAMGDNLATRGAKTEAERQAEAKRQAQLAIDKKNVEMGRTHGYPKPEDLIGVSEEQASVLVMRHVTEEKKKQGEGQMRDTAVVTVTAAESDKVRDAAVDAILARGGLKIDESKLQGNQFAGKRAIEIARRFATAMGERDARDWTEHDLGNYALDKNTASRRRSANVTSSNFSSYVLLNAMDKAVSMGFKAFGQNALYPKFTRTRQVADFKTVTGAALDVGNLIKTVEDAPFPELTKAEFGYQSALAMWGVTASLTLQALINDDLGEFVNQIFRSGQIANRTIEKEVASQIESATWTNNTSSGAGLGTGASPTPANLDVARSAFVKKTGPSGEILGNVPKFLIYQPTQGVPVGIALGKITYYAGASNGSVPAMSLEPIEHPFLTGTATTYYLVADPNLADTVVILKLNGMDTPQIEEYDPGAVAARKWKMYLPFAAKPVITSVNLAAGSTAYIAPGMQQATV